MLKDSGQSLLELTIAVGIAMVVLTAMTVITLTGLKNSQFSQNQANATKLAQDGIEQVRGMRNLNQDGSVCIDSSHYNWSQLWGYTCSNSCNFSIQTSGTCTFGGSANPYLKIDAGSGQLLLNRFYRKISIQDYCSNQKKILSTVNWVDSSGAHSVVVTTVLSNPSTQVSLFSSGPGGCP